MRLEQELQARGDGPSETVSTGVASAEDEFDRFDASEHCRTIAPGGRAIDGRPGQPRGDGRVVARPA